MNKLANILCIFVLYICFFSSPSLAQEKALTGQVSEVRVKGNRLVSDDEILRELSTSEGFPFDKNAIVEDLKKIYSMGYFEAKSVEAKPFRKSDGTLLIEFLVKENPPVNDLIVYGNFSMESLDVYSHFADMVAKPENIKLLGQKIRELETKYLTEGFILAKVIDLDLDTSGTLKIYIDEGTINNIVFKGNKKTQESYLKRLVSNVQINKPYNEKDFVSDFKRLQGTQYFASISRNVVPSEDQATGYDLEIEVQEKSTTSIGFGGGINLNTGLFGNVNTNFGNIKGRGESVNIRALIGSGLGAGSTLTGDTNLVRRSDYTRVTISHNIPFYRGSNYAFNKSLTVNRGPNFLVDLTEQNQLSLRMGSSKRIGNNHSFALSASSNYIDIDDVDRDTYVDTVARNIIDVDNITRRDLAEKTKSSSFINGRLGFARKEARRIRNEQIVSGAYFGLRPSYNYFNLDDPRSPHSGLKVNLNLNPVVGFNDVDSFTKFRFKATRFYPVGKKSTLIFNLRGGYTVAGTLPQFTKFRLGSATGVRGYRQFSELGVGNKLFIATAEFRTPIYNVMPFTKKLSWLKNVDFAVFSDFGAIGGDIRLNDITDRLSQAASVGFGVRVNIPLLGALRLDIGFPLVNALIGDDRLYRFNFGPANMF